MSECEEVKVQVWISKTWEVKVLFLESESIVLILKTDKVTVLQEGEKVFGCSGRFVPTLGKKSVSMFVREKVKILVVWMLGVEKAKVLVRL